MRMRSGSLVLAVVACLALAGSAGAADPLRPQQWGLTTIGADAARATADGAGATVAVIDSGAWLAHPDLQGRLIAGHDFIDGDENPSDGNGHGTHVAGVVAANAGNGVGVESVAPGARVLVIRALDNDGGGDVDGVAAGIRWAVDHGADVVNLSLGPEVPIVGGSGDFDAAIDYALDRGLVVVAAAGNGLLGQGVALPACDQPSGQGRLLCVGAVDRNESRAFYSNFGQGLSLSAPGGAAIGPQSEDILSTYHDPSSPYGWMAGTSQATPHVSGVAALLVSLGLRGQAATQRILATARDVGPRGPDATYGAGIVDARAAVAGLARPGGTTGGAGGGAGTTTGTGAGTQSAARIFLARRLSLRFVLRRGIRVGCLAAGTGRCRAKAYVGSRRIAAGSRAVTLGRRTTVTARLTPAGRRLLRAALRARRTLRARVYVSLPGAKTIRRTVLLRP